MLILVAGRKRRKKGGGKESATGLLNTSYSFHETQQGYLIN